MNPSVVSAVETWFGEGGCPEVALMNQGSTATTKKRNPFN